MSEFILNGEQVTARDDHPHLLAALRDELGITSAKDGCSPTGQCGCCTVLIGGKARVSCQTSMEKIDGGEVTTLEGFDPAEVQRMADAFAACGALQCGFCTPGIVVRTKALIDKNGADLTREQASRHLGAHLCRCTGYIKVLDAVEALAQDNIPVVVQPRGVGSRGIKYEGRELSIGTRDFIDDMNPEGCLHGALRLTDHARADIMSIDASAALAVDGVRGVFTAEDIPGVKRVGIIHKDWPIMIPVGGRTSYLGDVLVVVVADTRQIARAAAELVAVEYEVHEPMVDPVRVITSTEPAVWELDGNILSTSSYTRGDADVALATSSFTVSETFQTQRIEHAFLEPESTLAVPTRVGSGAGEPGLYVYSGGQGIWDDRNDIAAMLDIDTSRVTTELVSNGGAFGGKEDMSNQAHTALAAWHLEAPVKITLSREESLLMHPKRHPIRMQYDAGCDADGKLTAIKVRMIGDSGPYASVGMKVLERAAGHATGPYVVGNVDVEAVAARTNNSVC
jgi:aldehyde oxidoreductase